MPYRPRKRRSESFSGCGEGCTTWHAGEMDFRIFTEPQQGATYDDQLQLALASERLGFDAFFRSDHYVSMGDGDGLPGPTDAWTTLAGLARETSTIKLGTLVSSATFRHPGILSIQVAQVDQMSGGRVELGLGAGWFEAEHQAYGIPFPRRRFDRLTEQLEVISGLWATPAGQQFNYDGEHYQLRNSPALPKPAHDIPMIIGGHGAKRTPALAARFASEFNIPFGAFDDVKPIFDRVRRACEDAERDPNELTYSAAFVVCVGETEEEFVQRAKAIGRDPKELRDVGIAGTPAEAVDRLEQVRASGAERVYLQFLDMSDHAQLELIAADVTSHLSAVR